VSYFEERGRLPLAGDGARIWVLTVEFGGRTVRWASLDVAGLTLDGATVAVEPGLGDGLVYVDAISLSQGDPGKRAQSFDLLFPPDVSVASLEVAGHRLAGSPAELALVPVEDDGAVIEDRQVVLRGFVSQPIYGDDDQPVSFTVKGAEEDVDRVLPEASKVVSLETWPTATREVLGRSYPLPWGQPGNYRDAAGTLKSVPATPALIVESTFSDTDGDTVADTNLADTLLIADGRVAATQVVIWYQSEGTSGGWARVTCNVTTTTDGLDQVVSTVDVTGLSDTARASAEYAVEWLLGGGITADDGTTMDGAGAVALWWLRRCSVIEDYAGSVEAAAYLDAFGCEGHADEPTSPNDWVGDHLVGKLPAYIGAGANGSRLVPIRWRAQERDAVAVLVEGQQGVHRTGRVDTVSDGRATEVRVRWARDILSGEYRITTVHTPDPRGRAFERAIASHVARVAPVRTVVVDLPYCWDAATAQLVAEWTAWRDALPRREVGITVDPEEWGWLRAGDVVVYEDAGLGGLREVAIVGSIGLSDMSWWDVRLMLLRPTG
jgi:hypothetical protein